MSKPAQFACRAAQGNRLQSTLLGSRLTAGLSRHARLRQSSPFHCLANRCNTTAATRRFSKILHTLRSSPRSRLGTRWNSSKSRIEAAQEKVTEKSLSVSARFKELSRKYGWAAVGVYFGLSALDFPFCFLLVKMLGPERVGEAEHYVVNGFWSIVGKLFPSMRPAPVEAADADQTTTEDHAAEHAAGASIWTQLLLAYGVHKSLIFFRVPLTAAVTPKVVKYLRARGWKIGNPKAT